MIVVADASPLHYLVLIERSDILPTLYGRVVTSPVVLEELSHPHTPEAVRRWAAARPDWLQLQAPSGHPAWFTASLGPGERDAIALAEELHADVLFVDDRAARREAERRRLPIQGTLGVLGLAARLGFIDLPAVIARLRRTNFRADESLFQLVLDRDLKRKNP
jgi:predicted nucleic acid-binding protein